MRTKYLFAIACVMFICFAGCASTDGEPAGTSNNGALVIGVVLNDMDYVGRVDSAQYPVSQMSVKNLTSGQVYDIYLTSNHGIATLPSGTYCFNSLRPQGSTPLVYCAKPFFSINAGKILVAGFFEFAVNFHTRSYKLVDSFTNPQGLFDSLSQSEKDTLAGFSNKNPADTD
ncbi:MAG: hypothetical protein WCC11_08765 [Gammaproteobacteria bacterium]